MRNPINRVSGIPSPIQTADNYSYDTQQRVTSGPETSGSKSSYSYTNSNTDTYPTCSQPYCSHGTVDQMGIDAMPEPGSTAQLGAEYSGNGELCWVGEVTSTTGSCGTPSATSYETVTYNNSGDLTSTTAHTYGSNMAINWNVDTNEPTCIDPNGTTCTGPSGSQPQDESFTYNGDGLRSTEETWDAATDATQTSELTWDTISSLILSNGGMVFIYGQDDSPVAQIDGGASTTEELLSDPSGNVRGLVPVTTGATGVFSLINYTDYDAYGNPITTTGGTVNPGGLTESSGGAADSTTSLGFGGGYEDASGLVYLVQRCYEPSLGQFLSVDPELVSTGQAYSYASDSPGVYDDPTGDSPQVEAPQKKYPIASCGFAGTIEQTYKNRNGVKLGLEVSGWCYQITHYKWAFGLEWTSPVPGNPMGSSKRNFTRWLPGEGRRTIQTWMHTLDGSSSPPLVTGSTIEWSPAENLEGYFDASHPSSSSYCSSSLVFLTNLTYHYSKTKGGSVTVTNESGNLAKGTTCNSPQPVID